MTSTVQRELQELRAAAESYGARHVHLKHFAYPPGVRMAVNLTVDFDAMLLRRVHNEPPMQLAKGEFGGRVGIWRLLELFASHGIHAAVAQKARCKRMRVIMGEKSPLQSVRAWTRRWPGGTHENPKAIIP